MDAPAPATVARPEPASAERALLLACARVRLDDAQRTRIAALLRAPLDWPTLLDAAHAHRVVPLLARHLAGRFAAQCPPDVAARLAQAQRAGTAHNGRVASELVQLTRLLAAHRLRALAYRGPLLGAGVYGDLALRTADDAALGMPARQYRDPIPRVLAAHGWEALEDRDCARCWRKGVLQLDVRASFAPVPSMPLRLSFRGAWRRRAELALPEDAVPTLSPVDLAVVLAAELLAGVAGDPPPPLLAVCDVAEVVGRLHPAALRALARRARRTGALRIVTIAAGVAQRLLDVALPDALARALRRVPDREAILRHVEQRVLGGNGYAYDRPEWLDPAGWNAALRERAVDRAGGWRARLG